jgi:hypothetical protein
MAERLIRDQNRVPIAGGASNTDASVVLPFTIDSVTGRLLVDSNGGASVGFQTPTGTVNGSNTVFVFAAAPNVISIDGVTKQKVSSDTTINWTGTTTITLAIAPNFDIFGIA